METDDILLFISHKEIVLNSLDDDTEIIKIKKDIQELMELFCKKLR